MSTRITIDQGVGFLRAEAKPKKVKKKKEGKVKLSFAMDDDEDGDDSDFVKSKASSKAPTPANGSDPDDERAAKRAKLGKDPTVATSFLPDREREEAERAMREELRKEWLKKQDDMKDEDVEITCSYWDGSGHRTSITCKKGDTIAQFLNKCRQQFAQLRNVSVDNLMYIKEDLIIPHHYTFYDFIVNKYRGKSGPMFNFDVHDDVRMVADATVEKDESHAGKIVERSWYNRSKRESHPTQSSSWESAILTAKFQIAQIFSLRRGGRCSIRTSCATSTQFTAIRSDNRNESATRLSL